MGFLSSITKPFKKVIKTVGGPLGTIVGGMVGGPAGAAIGGAVGGGLQAQMGAEEQNSANKAAAQTQMDFQERMSNTSWQRGVADMRNAGINPILAYKMGGASTPIGAMPIMQNEGAAALDGASQMTNSAVAAKSVAANIANINAQSGLAKAQATTQSNIGSHLVAQAGKVTAEELTEKERAKVVKEQAKQAEINTQMLDMQKQVTAAGLSGAIAGKEWGSMNKTMHRIHEFMRLMGFSGNSALPNVNVNYKR